MLSTSRFAPAVMLECVELNCSCALLASYALFIPYALLYWVIALLTVLDRPGRYPLRLHIPGRRADAMWETRARPGGTSHSGLSGRWSSGSDHLCLPEAPSSLCFFFLSANLLDGLSSSSSCMGIWDYIVVFPFSCT